MGGPASDAPEFFRAILIGLRALPALGIPVVTAGCDFWVHPEALRDTGR